VHCIWIFCNKLDLNPETSFYYIQNLNLCHEKLHHEIVHVNEPSNQPAFELKFVDVTFLSFKFTSVFTLFSLQLAPINEWLDYTTSFKLWWWSWTAFHSSWKCIQCKIWVEKSIKTIRLQCKNVLWNCTCAAENAYCLKSLPWKAISLLDCIAKMYREIVHVNEPSNQPAFELKFVAASLFSFEI
jgi:hypothetical protein